MFEVHLSKLKSTASQKKKKSRQACQKVDMMNNVFLNLLGHKKRVYRECKQKQANWEDYKDVVQAARDQAKKAKEQTVLNLAIDIKEIKISFRYASVKRKAKKDVSLQKENGDFATRDMEKAEVLNDYFASVFTSKGSNCISQFPEGKGRD